jgi:hypothetical protein
MASKETGLVVVNPGPVSSRIRRVLTFMRPFWRNAGVAILVAALVLAAQLTLFGKSQVGVYIDALSLAGLVALALLSEKSRQLAISVAILPLANLISMSLPQSTRFDQVTVFYDALLLLALVYRFMFSFDYPVAATRLTKRGYLVALPLMVVVGQALGGIGYALLRNQYDYGHISLPLVAASTVVYAVAEAMLFQGLIQQRAMQILHPGMAAVLATVLYVATSFGHTGSYLAPLFALLLGATMAAAYYVKQNLLLVITLNAATKLIYFGLLATFVL